MSDPSLLMVPGGGAPSLSDGLAHAMAGSSPSTDHLLVAASALKADTPYAALFTTQSIALDDLAAANGLPPMSNQDAAVILGFNVPTPVSPPIGSSVADTSGTQSDAMQFLSPDTALLTSATGTATTGSGSETSAAPAITMTSQATAADYDEYAPDPWGTYYYDVPGYTDGYNFSNVNFSGAGNANDLGGSRDPAWVEPTLIHAPKAPTSDSGARADEVQTWFINNASTIGDNIIGKPLPADAVHSYRDWIHGEIKQHHRGNQEVVSDVFHQLATTGLAAEQINNIYHDVLGRGVDSDGLANTVANLSYGHVTLSLERQSVAHSQEAANDINGIWQRVLGRAPDSGALGAVTLPVV